MRIVPFYDRSTLIAQAVDTLRTTLLEEIALVTLAHMIFLMHFRSILIVTLPLPLAVLISFLGMYYAGISSNIMSLAGIAIAIGVLVDAGIVVTENAFRYVERRGVDLRDRPAVWNAVLESTRLVGRPVFFSMAIILLAFIPVFALTGQEGKLFHPLAFTKTFAVLAATIIAVTLVPVLCTLLIGGKFHDEAANPVMRALRRLYRPSLDWALSHRGLTLSGAVLLLAGALLVGNAHRQRVHAAAQRRGSPLHAHHRPERLARAEHRDRPASERRADAGAGSGVRGGEGGPRRHVHRSVAAQHDRDDRAPEAARAVAAGMTLDRLRAELGRAAAAPGVTNIWTMPIINRIDMLTTGVRSEVGVKIYGSDLAVLDNTARRVAEVVRTVRGAGNVYPEQVTSGQYLNVHVDRARGGEARPQRGLGAGGRSRRDRRSSVTLTLEGRRRFPVRVRYAPEYRNDLQALGNVLIATPSGQQLPLAQVVSIEQARGPAMINAENGLLLATVLLDVQGRDVGGFVEEAKAAVASRVSLPPGYFIGWSGRYENQERARQRLQIVVPIAIVIIFGLLYFTYHSALEAAQVLLTVPFALTGGVYLLWLLGYNFSVAVWVGFIALFGTAVQTGVVMVIYLEEALQRKVAEIGGRLTRHDLRDAVVEGALLRLRPKVMTVSTVVAGLLPIMWSNRVGAEVMKPLATPVLGGMVSSLLYVLIVTPVLFYWIHERRLALASSYGAYRSAESRHYRGWRASCSVRL